ncbi:nitroreductase/quinone reductase family protein [Streptomyces sp. MS06]|uniref:nitroreductase/quinone reductase family protein n=1 Tax=Streptomyces sp. MS06 TaxID=3385974 RepID=UPI00399FA1C9
MLDSVARALDIGPQSTTRERTVDITTIGARTGRPRRIEIWLWRVDGLWYLASDATPRAWYANLRAHPRFTLHLKHGVQADLPATAVAIFDENTRRRVLAEIIEQSPNREGDPGMLAEWVAGSPLVRVDFDDRE